MDSNCEAREQRIYIGNLPKDVKLTHLIDVLPDGYDKGQLEIRHNYDIDKNITSSYAFVNIVGSESDIRNWCFKSSKKSVGGNVLQVQFAKLSFLERLKQEVNSQKRNKDSQNVSPVSDVFSKPFTNSSKFKKKFKDEESSSTDSSSEDDHQRKDVHPGKVPTVDSKITKKSPKVKEDALSKDEIIRRESLKQRGSTRDNQQKLIRMSIKNVTNGPSNKIIFKDSDDEPLNEPENEDVKDACKKKLFDNSESENDDEFKFSEDQPKSKLIRTKVSAVDERFRMDSRFFDDNETQVSKKVENDSDNEQENLLKIADSIIGKDPNAKFKVKNKIDLKTVIPTRFNPLEKKHSSLIIKKDDDLITEVKKKPAKLKPFKVEKERFYDVSDTLKDQFKNNESTSFSLLGLFGGDPSAPKPGPPQSITPKNKVEIEKNKIKSLKNPLEAGTSNFFNVDEHSDIEEENQVKAKKPEKSSLTWNEPLFPPLDDPRIVEALKFFCVPMEEKVSHAVIRRDLKNIVKKKYLNNKARTKQFKTKLGGRRKFDNPHDGKKKKRKVKDQET